MTIIRKYGWQIGILILGLLLSLAITGVFFVRAARHASFRRVDEAIRPWMTLPYIAHSYRVPGSVLYQALNINPLVHDRRTVMALSKELKIPLAEVTAKLQQAIIQARPPVPSPTPKPPPNS